MDVYNSTSVKFFYKELFISGLKLFAPVNGKMEKNIFESINSLINLTLQKDGNIIFSDYSENCGIEIIK